MKAPLGGLVAAGALLWTAAAAEQRMVWKPVTATDKMLVALTQEWVDAEVKREPEILGRILDDRFVATFGAGPLINKADYIQAIVDDPDSLVSQTLTDEVIVVEKEAAVLVGTVAIRGTSHGKDTVRTYRYTVTYLRRGERWTALALHMVKAPPTE